MKIIIVGAGDVGFHLAKLLSFESQDIYLIDTDSEKLEYASNHFDVITKKGDATSIKLLKEININEKIIECYKKPIFDFLYKHKVHIDQVNVFEIQVSKAYIVSGKNISEKITFVRNLKNARFRVVLLGIHKKSTRRFFFNPIDDTLLETGDFLLVIGNYMFIKEFTKYLSNATKSED